MTIPITLISEGQPWRGLQSVSIRKSMDQAHHSFAATTTDRFQEGVARWNVRGGSNIELYHGSELLFTGQVNTYDAEGDGNSKTHSIQIAGDSLAADVVNYNHEGPYFWKGTTYEQIVLDVLRPYGFSATFSKELKPLPITGFRVAVNDKAFDIIRKIAEINGLTVFTQNDGKFVLSDGSDATGGTVLGRGDYTKIKTKQRLNRTASKVIVKSQKNDYKTGHAPQEKQSIKLNPAQPRYRPIVVLHTGEEGEQDDYARYLDQRFAGDSITAEFVVQSLYDKQGRLWGINQKVFADEPLYDLNDELLVADYALDFTEDACEVTLGLRLPQAYGPVNSSSLFQRRARRRSGGLFGRILAGILS